MKTLRHWLSVTPSLRITGGHWITLGAAAGMLTIEVVGRYTTHSDIGDGLALLALLMVVQLCVVWHNYRGLRWLETAAAPFRRLGQRMQGLSVRSGIDLRGEPPLPRALPRPLKTAVGLAFAVLALLVLANVLAPSGWRAWLSQPLYVGYLAGLAALWLAVLAAVFLTAFLQLMMLQEAVAAWRRNDRRFPAWPRQSGYSLGLQVGYLAALLVLGMAVPVVVPVMLSVAAAALLLGVMVASSRPDATVLWQARNGEAVRACSLRHVVLQSVCLPVLILWCLLAATLGSQAVGLGQPEPGAMPVTMVLGKALAWTGAGFLMWLSAVLFVSLRIAQRHDPARLAPTTLHVTPDGQEVWQTDGEALRERLREQAMAWRVAPEAAMATDVRVRLVAPPMPPVPREGPQWPVAISASALRAPELVDKLRRRDQVQRRRALVRGLQRLFKQAAARDWEDGTGYLVAPHLWFVSHLMRDGTEASEATTIGEPYHRVLAQPVRHHLYEMLRALEVDLIYVEDGVGFRQFRRVLRMIFELYDIHGGAQRAEDRFFTGIPGIRVIVEEHALDNPFRHERYPEPEYRILARGRILHVFRDRGGVVEYHPPPQVPEDVPLLVGV